MKTRLNAELPRMLFYNHFSECVSAPLPFYTCQIIKPFLNSRIIVNHDNELDFSQSGNPYTP